MVAVTTRSGKGSELTWAELDANFSDIASAINFLIPADVSFSTDIPFTGNKFMPQQVVTGAIGFTVGTGAVKGGRCYIRLVANGTNAPTFSGMRECGGSAGYDNRNGIVNQIEFWYDGYDYWYFINQEVNAVAQTGTAYGFALTGTSSFSAGSAVGATAGVASGATLTGTSSFSAGTADNGATAPSQVTGLTLGTATSTTQPLTWTAPSDGGSAITDYVVQYSPAGANTWTTFADGTSATASATVTDLSASTSYDYRVAAVNAIGQGSYSATATGSTSSASYPRFTSLNLVTESGTGPYSYTSGNTSGYYNDAGGVLNVALQSGVDGSAAVTNNAGTEFIFGILSGSTPINFASMPACLWSGASGNTYGGFTNGSAITATNSVVRQAGDIVRLRRSGSSLIGEVARVATPTSFTTIYTWSGISTGIMRFEINVNSGSGTVSNPVAVGLA